MAHNYYSAFNDNTCSENYPTDYANKNIELFESLNKEENLSNILINQNIIFNGIINENVGNNEQKITKIIFDVFRDKIEDDKISFNQDDDEKSMNNFITTGKKRLKECTRSHFTHIKNFTEKNGKNKIFAINKIIIERNDKQKYRLDYYKKKFKKAFLKFLLNYGKKLISKCQFEEQPKFKLHLPNYKLYSGNPREKDNKEFLKKSIKKVFMDYDKKTKKGTGRQIANEKFIKDIYSIKNFPSSIEEKALNDFFNMTIEDGIKLFYDNSEEFLKFKNKKEIQYYDKMFYREKKRNFSLLKTYGFIKLVNLPFYSNNPK